MGRFSLEESSEVAAVFKRRRLNRGQVENMESEEEGNEKSDWETDEKDQDGGEGGSNSDRELTFRIDTDVLDCSICFEPLRPPIFQCRNGHIACSSCFPKLLNKCHVCSQFIGRQQCLALEKVIKSIKSRCRYTRHGCKATLSFSEKASHEERCSHAALYCPITGCTFSGPKQLLTIHAENKHPNEVKKFSYDRPFMVSLARKEPFIVLLGGDGTIFLLLNGSGTQPRNVLSLICIGSKNTEHVFTYELTVHSRGSSLQLRTSAEKLKRWGGDHSSEAFLVIPDDFCTSRVEIAINVCIQKSSGIHLTPEKLFPIYTYYI